MSEEDTVSYHDEESCEEEEEEEGRGWAKATAEKYEINDYSLIQLLKLHERIQVLEKRNKRLTREVSLYKYARVESFSFNLPDFDDKENIKKRLHDVDLFESNKKLKKEAGEINLEDYQLTDYSIFM